MLRKTVEIEEKVTKFYFLLDKVMNMPRDFGTNELLYPLEIHIIDAVMNHPNHNTTEIASKLGYTKGTISKVTKSLEKKKYVKKYKLPDNDKEVYYSLTKKGEVAYNQHAEFETRTFNEMGLSSSLLSDDDISFLNNFFDIAIQGLEQEKEFRKLLITRMKKNSKDNSYQIDS